MNRHAGGRKLAAIDVTGELLGAIRAHRPLPVVWPPFDYEGRITGVRFQVDDRYELRRSDSPRLLLAWNNGQ